MGVNEIYDLLKKYRENTCTPEEKVQIIRWYQQYDDEVERLPEILGHNKVKPSTMRGV